MVKAVAALIDFCYLVRRNVISETALAQIQSTLERFHWHREIFRDVGVRPDGFSLLTRTGYPAFLCSKDV